MKKGIAIAAAGFMLLTQSFHAGAIVIRHDQDDELYLQADCAYPAVFDVSEQRGGVATLISPQWALTAAHVGQGVAAGDQLVIAGGIYGVRRVIVHPEWRSGNVEVALLQLDEPVEGVEPIPIYTESDELGQVVTVVGRGDTGTGITGPITRDHRLRAATNQIDRIDGDMLAFRFDAPADDDVTTLEGISGPGDSGGPALVLTGEGQRVAGLSVAQDSSGRERGTYGVWEFYTRVSAHSEWIEQTMAMASEERDDTVPDLASNEQGKSSPTSALLPGIYAGTVALAGLIVISAVVWYRHRRAGTARTQ